ncbi:acyltransferase [Mesorhizobium sp. M0615]|uniref:acyltransferase family protein n=1 Tax=Mesorhizobium sp. M0615 TaxID=2956971 RepID=UPI003339E7E5
MPKVFLSIQGLRGMAALFVVFHHYNGIYIEINKSVGGATPWLLSYGHLSIFGAVGVPVFFVISGFVIGVQQFQTGAAGVYDFMAKRAARIVPLYWSTTLIFACFVEWTPVRLVRSLLLVEGPANGDFPVLGPGWSLEYEMFFYICFAVFVVSGVTASKRAGITILIALFTLLASAKKLTGAQILDFFDPIILEFCGGLIIAFMIQCRGVTRPWPIYLGIGTGALIVSTTPLITEYPTIRTIWGVGAFFFVLGFVSGEIRGWVFMRAPPFQKLGAASYAIYLTHMILAFSLFRWPIWYWHWYSMIEPHLGLVLMASCAAACGLMVHFCYEMPINALLKRRLLRRPLPAPQLSLPRLH